MKISTNELEHLREEVKNCHHIIKDLQKKREFVGLTIGEIQDLIEHKEDSPFALAEDIDAMVFALLNVTRHPIAIAAAIRARGQE